MTQTHHHLPGDERDLRQDLAAALRLAVRHNMHEGICNHFSIALDDHRFLLNPFGIHWSRVCASDIITVDEHAPDNEAEITALCIHRAVHKRHPRGAVVLHAHMPYATALTCTTDPRLRPIHQNSLRFYQDVAYDNEYNGLAETFEEGERIAEAMNDKSVLFMANHGVMVASPTMAEAFDKLYYLERACEVQVLALSTGQELVELDAELAQRTKADFDQGSHYHQAHFEAIKPLLDRSYLR
jgi:ribulose-5-phosphate 4-epimerase/fuculose-1-phosphate aldolase